MKRLFAACLLPALAWAGPAVADPPADPPLYQSKPLDFWLHQLKDDDLLAREEARAVLADVGPAAETALPSLKDRLKDPAASVRFKEAVAVTEEVCNLEGLERGGAPEALRALAKDAANAVVKQEADAALDRLARKDAAP